MIVDAWAQHPTRRHLEHPMFDSLRRWTRGEVAARKLPMRLVHAVAAAIFLLLGVSLLLGFGSLD